MTKLESNVMKNGRDRPVLEITPAMIEAGEHVISYAMDSGMVFPDLLAVRVFQAMREAEA